MRTRRPRSLRPFSASSTPGKGSIGCVIISRPADSNFLDHFGGDIAAADFQRSLQHGKREALRAIAIGLHVLTLDGGELCLQRILVREIGQEFVEPLVGQPEHGFRVPERVVRIDADDRVPCAAYYLPHAQALRV